MSIKNALVIIPLIALACSSDGSAVEDGEWLPGGETTNQLLFGSNALTLPVANITADHELAFFTGNSFFNNPWVTAPASTESRDGLGPLFNARSCSACHFKDGRGAPPADASEDFEGILLRISIDGVADNGGTINELVYGGQIQPFAIDGVAPEARPTVTFTEVAGTYPDGTSYSLRHPTYELTELAYGPISPDLRISPRVAPGMAGLGLLEAITEERLTELADPEDSDGDGISGRINHVWDAVAETTVVGRFGWKAEQPTVRQQVAGAFLGDIGITSSIFPDQNCTDAQTDCKAAALGGSPNIEDLLLGRVVTYSMLLAVPARHDYKSDEVLFGKALFNEVGCASCHTANHITGPVEGFPELDNQSIWPYTDMLLHDMGEELSDHRKSFEAEGNEWRTPPLWALRFYPEVNGHNFLMHDGRARGVEEAILWHGGESETSHKAFENLDESGRKSLIRFVESL
tara:strand:+ start:58977 stop:60362 length:1386 start_codon:yes stop_codon:yes gene_type:complete